MIFITHLYFNTLVIRVCVYQSEPLNTNKIREFIEENQSQLLAEIQPNKGTNVDKEYNIEGQAYILNFKVI